MPVRIIHCTPDEQTADRAPDAQGAGLGWLELPEGGAISVE